MDSDDDTDKETEKKIYHYTDRASAKAIMDSGVIKASRDIICDAVYGEGAYLTTMTPDNSDKTLLHNNYDDVSRVMKHREKVR